MNSDSWLLTYEEHIIVAKYKGHLESKYLTKITVPHIEKARYSKNDVIFAFISGSAINIQKVKDFLQTKITQEREKNESVIMLSENESDESSTLMPESMPDSLQEAITKKCPPIKNKQMNTNLQNSDVENSVIILSESDPEISSTANSQEASVIETKTPKKKFKKKKKKRKRSTPETSILPPQSTLINSSVPEKQEVSSTTNEVVTIPKAKKIKLSQHNDDFLALNVHRDNESCFALPGQSFPQLSNQSFDDSIEIIDTVPTNQDESVIIIDSDAEDPPNQKFENIVPTVITPRAGPVQRLVNSVPTVIVPVNSVSRVIVPQTGPVSRPVNGRYLRPVVIDGSNVARSHGLSTNTFSGRGIQLSIDYFLKRGHENVTCFIPNYRRHVRPGPFQTTDPELIEEYALQQKVVFTPNRCYDDRFILDLACQKQAVILSNDNFRDIKAENPMYNEAVDKRLLRYCFVGDILMIPSDPLGRNGPKLDEFLSFPHGYVPTA